MLSTLSTLAARSGLTLRGGFFPREEDAAPPLADGTPAGTIVLIGWVGGRDWPAFAASPEAVDGRPDPLDRWSRRVIDALAAATGATALYPFGGPPWHPFQRWAQRAEPVHPSPLGILVHPDFGLWHSYRGALAFAGRLALPPRDGRPSPCETCTAKPCLSTCPVGAFIPGRYAVDACAAHLKSPAGRPCREGGCLARRACPVGADLAYGAAEAAFYMKAFIASR